MNTNTRKQLLAQLNWRYATKQFDPARKIAAEDWAALAESLRLSASSYGLQPWKFLVIEDPALRATLQGHSWGQSQIVDASHLVVFAAKVDLSEADVDAHLEKTATVRGIPVGDLAPFKSMVVGNILTGISSGERRAWAFNQAYIALGNLLTSAALLGIDTCPIEGFSREDYDRILGLPAQGLGAVVVAALGYRSGGDKYAALPKVRFDLHEVIQPL